MAETKSNVETLKDIKVRFTAEKIKAKQDKKRKAKKQNTNLNVVDIDDYEAVVELLEERQLLTEVINILQGQADVIKDLIKTEMIDKGIDQYNYEGDKAVSITDFNSRSTDLDGLKEDDPTTYSLYVTETKTKKINFTKINTGD